MRGRLFAWMTQESKCSPNRRVVEQMRGLKSRDQVSVFPTSWAFSSFMHPEHFPVSFSTNFGDGCEVEKVIVLCLGALLGLRCKWIIHAKNWRGALEKEQRAKTMKDKGLVRQINAWMQPLHCLKQYLFKHFLYAKYLAVDFALKDWHALYGFCEIYPFSPEMSSWHLSWNSTIPVWQECVWWAGWEIQVQG